MIIRELTLKTKNLALQRNFYVDKLGFNLISEDSKSFEIKAGLSHLVFEYSEDFKPYHFAFGVPYDLYLTAHTWLKERVTILKNEEEEIIDFPHWRAKAIYFYDADKNICEFISRKSVPKAAKEVFDIDQVYNISEIGLVTDNIKAVFDLLHLRTNVQMYDGSLKRFLAIGDDDGLFITIDPSSKKWFPTNNDALIADFKAKIDMNDKNYLVTYQDGKVEVLT